MMKMSILCVSVWFRFFKNSGDSGSKDKAIMNETRIITIIAPITSMKNNGHACIRIVMKILTLNDVYRVSSKRLLCIYSLSKFELDFMRFGV